ncbi:(2Fe-2S)-binding protein, partial [Streptomyces sp. NPDC006129]|uniref:(2Fe-2S)-binding protein n=1 Tax=Streptomyces sp. NPDC006129 TaxID=3155348 RepID=UPI0033AB9E1A
RPRTALEPFADLGDVVLEATQALDVEVLRDHLARTKLRRSAAALDSACAPPAHWPEQVTDDTVVCRCEEVTAGAVRDALDLGAGDERTVKLLTRAGMGWCQGRMCSTAVAGLAGCPPTPARRPFARPVPLGVLARHHPQEGLS